MKMKFISQSKSFYGFCLIKVYKFTFCSCEPIVYTVKSTKYKVRSLFTDPLFPQAGTPRNSWWGCAAQFANS